MLYRSVPTRQSSSLRLAPPPPPGVRPALHARPRPHTHLKTHCKTINQKSCARAWIGIFGPQAENRGLLSLTWLPFTNLYILIQSSHFFPHQIIVYSVASYLQSLLFLMIFVVIYCYVLRFAEINVFLFLFILFINRPQSNIGLGSVLQVPDRFRHFCPFRTVHFCNLCTSTIREITEWES